MQQSQSSTHPINEEEPNGFEQRLTTEALIRYMVNGNNDYEFDYKVVTVSRDKAGFLEEAIEQAEWHNFYTISSTGEIARADLDFDIRHGDHLVTVRTVPEGRFDKLFWSPTKAAIMTDKDRKKHYGKLEYFDGGTWTAEIPSSGQCREMRFRAKLNDDLDDKKHKFSYNVFIESITGGMRELEIDPDIRNPSV
jgi:hypothetical protein